MRVLFAWEMGKNYGHVTQIVDVAKELAERGADITIALQQPETFHKFSGAFKSRLMQAPFCPPGPAASGDKRTAPLCYPDDLLPCGYGDPAKIAAMVSCWRSLYELARPDILIAQAAPTALLAARGTGIKTAVIGKGYDVPPLASPMPPLRYWDDTDAAILAAHEARVLTNINAAMQRLSLPALKTFSDMLHADETFLCTFRELDHYPLRDATEYYGPFIKSDSGAELSWNTEAKKRIFAYIRPGTGAFTAAVNAMLRLPPDHDIVIAAPGISATTLRKASKENLRIVNGPVRLDRLTKECDLAIHHASAGTGCALAKAGVPALMLPNHIEQMMFARAIGRAGLGRGLAGEIGVKDILRTIGQLLTDPQYRQNAQSFAAKYESFDPAILAVRIADRIMSLKSGHQAA